MVQGVHVWRAIVLGGKCPGDTFLGGISGGRMSYFFISLASQ